MDIYWSGYRQYDVRVSHENDFPYIIYQRLFSENINFYFDIEDTFYGWKISHVNNDLLNLGTFFMLNVYFLKANLSTIVYFSKS